MKYIDLHTHSRSGSNDIIEVLVKDFSHGEKIESRYETIGIHPWSSTKISLHKVIEEFGDYIKLTKPKVLGEIGLDRVSGHDLELQKSLFSAQVEIAKKNNINCLIIHSVKAYSDILHILLELDFKGKIIFHDYNSNIDTSEQVSKHFDTYYSFGKKLFNSKTQAAKVLPYLPLDKIFLETDDNQNLEIKSIYTKASELLKCTECELKKQIYNNFNKLSSALFTDNA